MALAQLVSSARVPAQAGFFWVQQDPLEYPEICREHGAIPEGLISCPQCAEQKSAAAKEHVAAIESHEDAVAGAVQMIRMAGSDAHVQTSGNLTGERYVIHLVPSKTAAYSFCDAVVIPGRTQGRKLTDVSDRRYHSLYCSECLKIAGVQPAIATVRAIKKRQA